MKHAKAETPAPGTPTIEIDYQVMFFDTDCAAVVHNLAYLRIIETARTLLADSTLMPLVGLDFHTARQLFPLTMAIDVGSTLSESIVLDSLRARRCHARAFGLPLDHELVRTSLPALSAAEQGRRLAASIARRSNIAGRAVDVRVRSRGPSGTLGD